METGHIRNMLYDMAYAHTRVCLLRPSIYVELHIYI